MIVIIFNHTSAPHTSAQGIRFNSEINGTYSDTETELKTTGEKIKSSSYSIEQRYNLNLSKIIYPYLTFDTGTIFQWNNFSAETDGTDSELEERILRPFVALRLTNPLYQAGIEYRRTEIDELNPDATNTESSRDEVDALLGWRPSDLPQIFLRYNFLHSYDDPETVDTIENSFDVETNYSPWRQLRLDYSYTYFDTEDRIRDFDTLEQTHFGRIGYADQFWNGRLSVSGDYNISHNTLELPGTGTEEVSRQRREGLFELDNTPEEGELTISVAALIDGNLTASAGINIGREGDQTRLANIGLDFGIEVEVEQIRLWVNRRLSSAVADSFSWSVYVSPDNTPLSTWTLVAVVFPADFGTFENRFTINFPRVNTRFIKVVTSALSPLVPGSINFENILVTEMQAFAVVSGVEVTNKITSIEQNASFGLTGRLGENTTLGYNLNYISQEEDPADVKDTQLSNTIFMNHILNEIFSTGARLTRIDTSQSNEDRVSYTYNAFVRGAYLPTFDQTLTFSGDNTQEEDDSSDVFSLILRNNAILYQGWSGFLDSGVNYNRPTGSDEAEKSMILRVGTNFQPNPKLSVNVNYRLREIFEPEKTSSTDLNIEAFFVPTRTLSINASFSLVERTNAQARTFQNYVVSWSPSPDGDLQFIFSYTETLTSELDERRTTIGPGLNWSISRHFSLELFYNMIKQKSDIQKVKSNSVFSRLRMTF
jgi:hypothetical protein